MSELLSSLGLAQTELEQSFAEDTEPDTTVPERLPVRSPAYRRLQASELASIARLRAEGLSGPAIAAHLGRSTRTVYEALESLVPTIDFARSLLDNMAVTAVDTLSDTMLKGVNDRVRMESAVKVLESTGLAPTGDSKGHSVQVAVVIGGPAQCPIPVSD